MDQWIPAKDCIVADVIRWTEGVYDRRRRGKALRIGERQVSAEVLEWGKDGWARLLVRACTVTKDEFAGRAVQPVKAGETMRRSVKTIMRGKPHRLLWDDESARDAVVSGRSHGSRFISQDEEE